MSGSRPRVPFDPGPRLAHAAPVSQAVERIRARVSKEVIVGVVFVSAMFMSVMDVTVVNTAIPTLARDFHATNSSVEWVVTGYLLSLAVWIPASGWIGDRFGAKRVLLFAIAVFTCGSMLCAAANGVGMLTLARVVQGVGGGMLQPVGMALLFRTFPPERRARASQILIIPTAVAPAIGPIIGGLLVEHASWRWVFLINVPIGIAAFTFGAVFLDRTAHASPGRFDVAGFVLAGAGLPLLLFAASRGPIDGWTSTTVLGCGAVALALLAAFVVVELRIDEPLLYLRILRDRLFLDCTLVGVVGFGAFLGTLFIVPLYLQQSRGFSPLSSGLTTFPEALGVVTSVQIAGRLYPRIGPRRLTVGGLLWLSLMLVWAATLFDGNTSLWLIRLFMFGIGTGVAYVVISQQAAAFTTVAPDDMGRATAISAAIRQSSAAAGIALLATVLAIRAGHGSLPGPTDFRPVFLTAAAMALIGALVALRIRDSDAAATMRRNPPTTQDDLAAAALEVLPEPVL
jgi:EmrB/QacA subfamily drug resistance transporter